MTAQYEALDTYKICFGDKIVFLNDIEISEIQRFNFKTMKQTKSVGEIEYDIEQLKLDLYNLTNKFFDEQTLSLGDFKAKLEKLI